MAKSKTIDIKVGKRKYPLCRLVTFHHSNVVPAECD